MFSGWITSLRALIDWHEWANIVLFMHAFVLCTDFVQTSTLKLVISRICEPESEKINVLSELEQKMIWEVEL